MLSEKEIISLLQSLGSLPNAIESVSRSGEGGEHLAWIINDSFVLRVPASQSSDTSELEREQQLWASLRESQQDQDSFNGLLPVCIQVGQLPSQPPVAFGLYEKLPGISVEASPSAVNNNTEEDLTRLLTLLKETPTPHIAALGVPEPAQDNVNKERQDARIARQRLQEKEQFDYPNADIDALLSYKDIREEFTPVIQHADLKGEHIFIDPATGRVTGIIDWSDTKIGHPSADIGGLAISVGARMASRAGRKAGYSDDVVRRGIVLARCRAIALLDETLNVGTDCPEWLLRVQLQRALEDTET